MSRGGKVVVAGAGALGLSAALALANAGCAVRVCDPAIGANASAVAAGMLAPAFEAALDPGAGGELDLLLAARNLWPGLAAQAGVGLDRSGAMAIGDDDWLADVAARLVRLGFRPAELGRSTLEALAPGLSPVFGRALLAREDWRLQPRQALAALRRAAEAAGVMFSAARLVERGDADMLVIATGVDGALAAVAPELADLTPIKGQILRFADRCGAGVSLRTQGAYAVPGSDGLAVGATMEVGRDDTTIDPAELAPIAAAAARLYPALADAASVATAGVRAATLDGLPLAGPSRTPGVILAVGARRNGWLLAPLVAQVVTAYVTGRDPGRYAKRLDPRRFYAGLTTGGGTS